MKFDGNDVLIIEVITVKLISRKKFIRLCRKTDNPFFFLSKSDRLL